MALKRIGECNNCGECCKHCFHYKDKECDIYNKRPKDCVNYPSIDDYIKNRTFKECGFKFIKNGN